MNEPLKKTVLIKKTVLKRRLEKLYKNFDRSMISPDPLECVPTKGRFEDIELSAFIASAFAYGRADLIVRTVRRILDELGPNPHRMLVSGKYGTLYRGFKYRFHKRADLIWLLGRLEKICKKYGTIENAFSLKSGSMKDRIAAFSAMFTNEKGLSPSRRFLVPSPLNGSACKRMNLFLRWMVRSDAVDLGIWKSITPSELIIPLDVHVRRIASRIGLVSGGAASFKAAEELTRNMKALNPTDPVRYDFAICSLGKLGRCTKKPDPLYCKTCALKDFCSIR
ncbi:MAG: TIGR02757 family protein [bacterium]|nr:MAG: TIGR02757 family protein [bacterium]